MATPNDINRSGRIVLLTAGLLMLILAFVQCLRTAHGIQWFYDPDYYRDMSGAIQNLTGNFGKDPNYKGEWLWYNPLLPAIEALAVRFAGQPINVVFGQAGVWLNLLSPITFTIMLAVLFDLRTAIAGLLAF